MVERRIKFQLRPVYCLAISDHSFLRVLVH
nr:MAG TPA: hypothetical protein [Bacteriophage sp.]